MAAKDQYHQAVITALEKDGWIIRRDPLAITYLNRTLFVDLAIDGLSLIAEKFQQQIAIEIKSFLSNSPIKDLQEAIGQYLMYEVVLQEIEPTYELWLAIPSSVHDAFFQEEFTRFVVEKIPMNLVIFDKESATIVKWIRSTHTGKRFSN